MIITRTPFRISLVGGGTDLPSFYHQHEGCVLSTTIDKYMYIVLHPTFNKEDTIVKYNKTEIVKDVRDIQHPIARELLLKHNVSGIEVTSMADVLSGTGLSTSSAYTVGLINALHNYKDEYYSQAQIAEEACDLELNILKEPIGKQDQYGTAIGGMKMIKFLPNEEVKVKPIYLKHDVMEELNSNLMLFYTGITHSASEILKEQSKNIINEQEKVDKLIQMTDLVYDARRALSNENLDELGYILHTNWLLKRSLASKISNSIIDRYYDIALDNGALGGKLLGAGSGGFLLFYCPKEKQARLRASLDLVEMPFTFEEEGTKVIYYNR